MSKPYIKELPKGWITACLEEITTKPQYGWTCKASKAGNLKLLRTTDMSSGSVDWNSVPFCLKEPKDPSQYYLKSGDILVSRAGSVGKSFLIAKSQKNIIFASYLIRFKPLIESKYIYYFMQSRDYWNQLEEKIAGIALPNVNASKLCKIEIPIAPLKEQKRIVFKIEELFSDLDKAESTLKQTQRLLEQYKQSILKAAVTGELTKEWREKYQDKIESRSRLRERNIKLNRENINTEDKLRNLQQEKQKNGESKAINFDNLPAIPNGWIWATLDQLGELSRGKSKHRPRNDPSLFLNGKYPFLQTSSVRSSKGKIVTYNKLYNDLGLKQSRLWPKGTVCITIAANIAESGILELDACFPDSIVGLIPDKNISGEFVEFFIRTIKNQLNRFAPATAQKNINLDILSKVAVPLPSYEEQIKICECIQKTLSVVVKLKDELNFGFLKITRLRQSILKAAFSGQLIPQDPNDEPPEELLKRIKLKGKINQPKQKLNRSPVVDRKQAVMEFYNEQ